MWYVEKPAIVGHRGSGRTSQAPDGLIENTSASIERALQDGADGVEVDAQLSSDGTLVVYHNHTLPSGQRVRDTPLAELEQHGIETLDAIMSAAQSAQILNIEVKTGYTDPNETPDPSITAAVVEASHTWDTQTQQRIVVSSFDPEVIRSFRAQTPEIRVGLLTAPYDWRTETEAPLIAAVSWARTIGAGALHANIEQLRTHNPRAVEEDVRAVHEADLGLMVWCPTPEQAAALLRAGADAVCVDQVHPTRKLIA